MSCSVSHEFIIFFQVITSLGLVIYSALDFGLKDSEERKLSPELENILDLMTSLGQSTTFFHFQNIFLKPLPIFHFLTKYFFSFRRVSSPFLGHQDLFVLVPNFGSFSLKTSVRNERGKKRTFIIHFLYFFYFPEMKVVPSFSEL